MTEDEIRKEAFDAILAMEPNKSITISKKAAEYILSLAREMFGEDAV